MERKLASIQVISNLENIANSDHLQKAKVLGWTIVVSKNDCFKIGDSVVFFEIDSILPGDQTWAEFLKRYNYRIKTIKLRGILSQGLILPLSILPKNIYNINDDVTEILNIKKYEPNLHNTGGANMMGQTSGNFPHMVSKTDEVRLQSKPELIKELKLLHKKAGFYVATKYDGTSATYCYDNNEFCACSRNYKKKEDDTNIYWQMVKKYNLKNIIENNKKLAISGEIAGPSIQGNKLKLLEIDFFVFTIYDTIKQKRLSWFETVKFCEENNLKMVETQWVCEPNNVLNDTYFTLDFWLKRAEEGNVYSLTSNNNCEGIVVRTLYPRRSKLLDNDWFSFKVISNNYLLKEK